MKAKENTLNRDKVMVILTCNGVMIKTEPEKVWAFTESDLEKIYDAICFLALPILNDRDIDDIWEKHCIKHEVNTSYSYEYTKESMNKKAFKLSVKELTKPKEE